MTANLKKTTKTELHDATNNFMWRLDWFTGGTKSEYASGVDAGEESLRELANVVESLRNNLNAHCLKDSHLMERSSDLLGRVDRYVETAKRFQKELVEEKKAEEENREWLDLALQITGEMEAPSNIIPFPAL